MCVCVCVCVYIQWQPKETERLSSDAKMASYWKEEILPKIVTVNVYVFSLYMNS